MCFVFVFVLLDDGDDDDDGDGGGGDDGDGGGDDVVVAVDICGHSTGWSFFCTLRNPVLSRFASG